MFRLKSRFNQQYSQTLWGLIFLVLCSCSQSSNTNLAEQQNDMLDKDSELNATDTIAKNNLLTSPVPEPIRDTVQAEILMRNYRDKFESTDGLDTLINGTYFSIYDQPKFTLIVTDTISQGEFLKRKSQFETHQKGNPMLKQLSSDLFSLTTAKSVVNFKSSNRSPVSYYTNLNYIPDLHAVMFVHAMGSGGAGSGSTWLLDSLSNNLTQISSYYEHGFDHVSVSENKDQLICAASNQYFEAGAAIKILNLNLREKGSSLSYQVDFQTKDWSVGECYIEKNGQIIASAYTDFDCHYKTEIDPKKEHSDRGKQVECETLYLVLEIVEVEY